MLFSNNTPHIPLSIDINILKSLFQSTSKRDVADNIAVINATDLSPIIEHTQVKEIREVVASGDSKNNSRAVEISLKVAELPTTTPIEVVILFRAQHSHITFHF